MVRECTSDALAAYRRRDEQFRHSRKIADFQISGAAHGLTIDRRDEGVEVRVIQSLDGRGDFIGGCPCVGMTLSIRLGHRPGGQHADRSVRRRVRHPPIGQMHGLPIHSPPSFRREQRIDRLDGLPPRRRPRQAGQIPLLIIRLGALKRRRPIDLRQPRIAKLISRRECGKICRSKRRTDVQRLPLANLLGKRLLGSPNGSENLFIGSQRQSSEEDRP